MSQSKRGYEHGCHTHGTVGHGSTAEGQDAGWECRRTALNCEAQILLLFQQGDVLKASSPKFTFNRHRGRYGGKVGTFTLGPGWTSACLDISGQRADGWTREFISRVALGWQFVLVPEEAPPSPLTVLGSSLLQVQPGTQRRRGCRAELPCERL